ncbi:S41 family peptidase [Cesiribacter andamanensis]|uniref:Uncharacterized protein n=1 Tax=Cesiribacter andamanensis AMV16 TaxID=1279009 RepID=M7NBP8_9BACT|nr:hypothetical protein [Cesiribacter andamanensis]EMR04611.1 hypothetical protein ADICEAN_00213 [Cesiribacter andamanensis AMV16]
MKRIFFPLLLAFCASVAYAQQQQPAFNEEAYVNAQQQVLNNPYLLSPYAEQLSPEDRLAGLSLLWSEAKFNFANFDLAPINLDSLYKAYLPQVMAAQSTFDYYQLLRSFYARLRDGHTGVGLPQELWARAYAHPGVEAALVEGRVVLHQLYAGVSLPAPMALGDEVVAIDGLPVAEYIRQRAAPYVSFSSPQDSIARILRYDLFFGDASQPIQLQLRNRKGKLYAGTLQRLAPKGFFQSGLPVGEYKVLPGNIGYLALNTFNDEAVLPFLKPALRISAKPAP